jgi:hypothetical protein
MKVDRKQVHCFKKGSGLAEKTAPFSGSEAVSFVWELTQEVFSLSGKFDVESRLQRHVVTVVKKRG